MHDSIVEVKRRHESRLMALPGVVAVGIGQAPDGSPAIMVGLDDTRPETRAELPDVLESHPVIAYHAGTPRAQ
jgi:hypothetical protein